MTDSRAPFIVMGVSGCGKSTIAQLLAESIGADFIDADDFHPADNKTKMAAGVPLDDSDRWPWLDALNKLLRDRAAHRQTTVLACSALRQAYRDVLARELETATFIYLAGSKAEIQARMEARSGHFMPSTLLDSQFATLEEPTDAIRISIVQSPEKIVAEILVIIGIPSSGQVH
jgi:carbohydrate kinase (thermoresistant glucokinase family)